MINEMPYKVFRCLLSLIFIVAGIGHLFRPAKLVHRLELSPGWPYLEPFFAPQFLIIATGVVLTIGGLGLLFNIRPKWSSAILISVLIPITLTVQISLDSLGPLFKNVAILGGLILVLFGSQNERTIKEEA